MVITNEARKKLPVAIAGIAPDQVEEIELRLSEFERDHLVDIVRGGPGYVPKIQTKDYVIGVTVNVILGIWFVYQAANMISAIN